MTVLGVGAVSATFVFVSPKESMFAPAAVGGAGLALMGATIVAKSLLYRPPPPAPRAAHLTFYERARHAVPPPSAKDPRPVQLAASPSRPPTDEERHMAELDREIRDVSRQIDKAKVMYGTGKLSREGYVAYVRDLEAKRGTLEAKRAHIQLSGA
ncbi:MAG TPA: hypothetical protein VI997_09350 [Candidatus Thermoplasmatota archaeon]|nr:hypothetical protein [Candidatus Thermoplasmatota archaeon]